MSRPPTRSESGVSLLELLVGLFMLAVGALAVVPMFAYAMHANASSRDLSSAGMAAERRLELLREADFASLAPGGSLASDVVGYVDTPEPGTTVRWRIVDHSAAVPDTLLLRVRAMRRGIGQRADADVTIVSIRGD